MKKKHLEKDNSEVVKSEKEHPKKDKFEKGQFCKGETKK